MQIMLVRDASGNVRVAYNTCQVCNGSPMAYFVQRGSNVICQNCGNSFAINEIGDIHGGCNPIPVKYTEIDNEIRISDTEIAGYSSSFTNWKKGI